MPPTNTPTNTPDPPTNTPTATPVPPTCNQYPSPTDDYTDQYTGAAHRYPGPHRNRYTSPHGADTPVPTATATPTGPTDAGEQWWFRERPELLEYQWRTECHYQPAPHRECQCPALWPGLLLHQLIQTVSLPATMTSGSISYWYRITTAETSASCLDRLTVSIRTTAGGTISLIQTLCNTNKTNSWVEKTLVLPSTVLSRKGQSVQVAFLASGNTTNATTFDLDDVSLLATMPAPPTSTPVPPSATPTNTPGGVEPPTDTPTPTATSGGTAQMSWSVMVALRVA